MKKLLLVPILLLAVAFSGCYSGQDNKNARAYQHEQQLQQRIATEKEKAVGNPRVSNFAESQNLKRRYEELDDPNAVGYVYLINYGHIFGEYKVQGKVSSLNSSFTDPQAIQCARVPVVGMRRTRARDCEAVGQAEPDGSYGDNPQGIFFWTTDDVYVEWSGDYQYSRQRLTLHEPVSAVLEKRVP